MWVNTIWRGVTWFSQAEVFSAGRSFWIVTRLRERLLIGCIVRSWWTSISTIWFWWQNCSEILTWVWATPIALNQSWSITLYVHGRGRLELTRISASAHNRLRCTTGTSTILTSSCRISSDGTWSLTTRWYPPNSKSTSIWALNFSSPPRWCVWSSTTSCVFIDLCFSRLSFLRNETRS